MVDLLSYSFIFSIFANIKRGTVGGVDQRQPFAKTDVGLVSLVNNQSAQDKS